MLSNILTSIGRQIRENQTAWGTLMLFAAGLVILLSMMTFMPYPDSALR
ncbi:hypothetical protein [cf. Phormidesmis sp. LEGE 11477]|nr:hypothetical protein [cf. Phormidesmis sp. LEGE 11477]MBE9059865.1 hypothetical protein [cf. Phormidesmis sp. LEGE 11477]